MPAFKIPVQSLKNVTSLFLCGLDLMPYLLKFTIAASINFKEFHPLSSNLILKKFPICKISNQELNYIAFPTSNTLQ